MEKTELRKWRYKAPGIIAALAVTPLFWKFGLFALDVKSAYTLLDVPFGLVVSYFYNAASIRKSLWIEELEGYVGRQIRAKIVEMLPANLMVTSEELAILREKKIINRLNGIFWEAVDRDQLLTGYKESFYDNGKHYTTAIDVFVICGVLGYAYLIGLYFESSWFYLITSAALISISIIAWYLVIPARRRDHLQLSLEQLETLRRNQADFVQKSFENAVSEMRASR